MDKHSLLSDLQHGFHRRRSSESQLTIFIDELMRSVKDGNQVAAVVMDFSKVFDVVPHGSHLVKLDYYRTKAIPWSGYTPSVVIVHREWWWITSCLTLHRWYQVSHWGQFGAQSYFSVHKRHGRMHVIDLHVICRWYHCLQLSEMWCWSSNLATKPSCSGSLGDQVGYVLQPIQKQSYSHLLEKDTFQFWLHPETSLKHLILLTTLESQ